MGQAHFKGLVYTLANEDSAFEASILPTDQKVVFAIAGSGSRVLPLLSKNPKKLVCVDLSKEQLYLTELRIESLRSLSHNEFLQFWGYPSQRQGDRKSLFGKIQFLSAP